METSIVTRRLTLTAVTVDDATEMVSVLEDARLHEFIGGRPASLEELRHRYGRWVVGSRDPSEVWVNWVVRTRLGEVAVGTLRATISTTPDGRLSAEVAWVIGVA